LEDLSLTDLFRSEVETHSEVLSNALLALERAPGETSRVDEMMRAAHSIKGAARVVGIEPAVSVAHVMEDCFVAAQKGALTLSSADVDVLLRGVDMLGRIAEATKDPKADLAGEFEEVVKGFVRELEVMLVPREKATGTPVAAPSAIEPHSRSTAASPTREPAENATSRPETIAVPELLDATAAEEVRRRYIAAVGGGCDPIRLDLGATKDLDVQGLTLLAAIPRHVARHGGPRLELVGLSAEMETVLVVTGLGTSYGIHTGPPSGGREP
jgi:two-component system sensor histidine kinase and response regulator WspE